eukprot:2444216-Rhodomonas_salina.1
MEYAPDLEFIITDEDSGEILASPNQQTFRADCTRNRWLAFDFAICACAARCPVLTSRMVLGWKSALKGLWGGMPDPRP